MVTSIMQVQQDYHAPQLSASIVKQAKKLNVSGTLIFLAGFAIWNLGLASFSPSDLSRVDDRSVLRQHIL